MLNTWSIPYWDIFFRLVLAVFLGGLIGWERELSQHPAGFRTHILVCLGSALIMLISIYGFSDFMVKHKVNFDPARISAQVVSGIGFLGAGTILRHGFSVTGLTTAASLWVVSGIGLAVGSGFMFAAILTTVLTLVSLELLNKWDTLFALKKVQIVRLVVADEPGKLGEISSLIARFGGSIRKVDIEEEEEKGLVSLTFKISRLEKESLSQLYNQLKEVKGVKNLR